jgi:REP element-mobilizing transposase RayT
MPRAARKRLEDGVYHVIVRSISDVKLFHSNSDKDQYLKLIKKYQELFLFRVYSYCIMDNHAHFIIDCSGADISKFMKLINQCYAMYFNKKYDRHGHVFQDRFKSILVDCDQYLVTLSAYIHNNVKDIWKYKDRRDAYKYSSLGILLGLFSDDFGILDTEVILKHFSEDIIRTRMLYKNFVLTSKDLDLEDELALRRERSDYRSEKKIIIRNFKPEDIVRFVEEYTGEVFNIHIKYNHRNSRIKAVCVTIMRSLCNFTFKQICEVLGNVTLSSISVLCEKGLGLITKEDKYKGIIRELIMKQAVA